MDIDEKLSDRARFLLFSTLELLRKEIRSDFSDWKDADDWLFSELDITQGELAQIYEGRNVLYYDGSAVKSFEDSKQEQGEFDFVPVVKLEIGMVGVLKRDDDIKKELRGRAFRIVEEPPVLSNYAICAIEGKEGTYMVAASQMRSVGPISLVLGDVFETKRVDGHLLAGVDREPLIDALNQAPLGTVITGVRAAPGSYEYGKYDFDTHIEKRGGYVQNYFAPVKTKDYDTWWTVSGATRSVYDIANILLGKSKYYALTPVEAQKQVDSVITEAAERATARSVSEEYKDMDR